MTDSIADASSTVLRVREVEVEFPQVEAAGRRLTRVRVSHDANGSAWLLNPVAIDASTLAELRSQHESGEIELVEEQMPDEDFRAEEMAWVQSHRQELAGRYAGQWIAIEGSELVAHASDIMDLLRIASENGHPHPFVTAVPGEPLVNLYL